MKKTTGLEQPHVGHTVDEAQRILSLAINILDGDSRITPLKLYDPHFFAPTLVTIDSNDTQLNAIPLKIGILSNNTDFHDDIIIKIDNVPADAKLSAGHRNKAGAWVLNPDQLDNLCLLRNSDDHAEIKLTVQAIALGDEGEIAISEESLDIINQNPFVGRAILGDSR